MPTLIAVPPKYSLLFISKILIMILLYLSWFYGSRIITNYIYKSAGHAFANHRRAETYQAEVTHEADARTFSFFEKWLETTDETKSFSKD